MFRPLLSDAELSRLRAMSPAWMQDGCLRLAYDGSATDDFGKPDPTYTPEAESQPCLFKPTSSEEVSDGSQVVVVEAEVWVGLGTTWARQDRFQLIERYGEVVTPVTYEIVAEPVTETTGIHLLLRSIHSG